MNITLKIGVAFTSALLVGAPTYATETNPNDQVSVVTVDYKGKPPFNRRVERMTTADLAVLEANEAATTTTKLTSIDFRGKPPFRRNFERLTVVDTAVLETNTASDETNFRGRPPFKRKP